MKIDLRRFISILFVVVCEMLLLAGNAQAADDAFPPELRALIGMKILPSNTGNEWTPVGGWSLDVSPHPNKNIIIGSIYKDDLSVFATELIDATDQNRTIVDARVLPKKLLNYDIKDGKFIPKKNPFQFYTLQVYCEHPNFHEKVIVGLIRPEHNKEDCTHKTTQVKLAWSIDQKTGHISEMPTKDVSCLWEADNYCQ